MEHSFRLSQLFPNKVSVIGSDLIPLGCPALKEIGERVMRERTTEIVNSLGRASAEAQLLSSVITSADRLCGEDCRIYLYCDFISNKVVGFLRIGKQKLLLFDSSGMDREIKPMCILDFHIFECSLHHGAGTYLFDYMLRKEAIPVEHFAFDSPSDKFIHFLNKHYNLTSIFPQANNIYIFDRFFRKRADSLDHKNPWHGLDQTPTILNQVALPEFKEQLMGDSQGHYHHQPLTQISDKREIPFDYVLPKETPQSLQQQNIDMVDEQLRHVSIGDPPQQRYDDDGQRRHFFMWDTFQQQGHHGKDFFFADTPQPSLQLY